MLYHWRRTIFSRDTFWGPTRHHYLSKPGGGGGGGGWGGGRIQGPGPAAPPPGFEQFEAEEPSERSWHFTLVRFLRNGRECVSRV